MARRASDSCAGRALAACQVFVARRAIPIYYDYYVFLFPDVLTRAVVWLGVMGVATHAVSLFFSLSLCFFFPSTAARMQLHHAAHCVHMVSTDKAPLCFFLHA